MENVRSVSSNRRWDVEPIIHAQRLLRLTLLPPYRSLIYLVPSGAASGLKIMSTDREFWTTEVVAGYWAWPRSPSELKRCVDKGYPCCEGMRCSVAIYGHSPCIQSLLSAFFLRTCHKTVPSALAGHLPCHCHTLCREPCPRHVPACRSQERTVRDSFCIRVLS